MLNIKTIENKPNVFASMQRVPTCTITAEVPCSGHPTPFCLNWSL